EVGRILRAMHEVDFLGRYVPEFGAMTALVQHEFFHRYTADEHTLVCVEKLDSLLFSGEPKLAGYRSLFQKIEDPAVLYLAILLHDTGKASNSRNHEDASALLAHKVSRRLQLSSARRRSLITLVNSHIELSMTAQRRNLDDPATIAQMAAVVGNVATLDALMLLTLADGMGTSDEGCSDWKEGLVWTLYSRTRSYLESGKKSLGFFRRSVGELREEVERRLPRDFGEEIAAHFGLMPARYFPMFDSAEISEHLRLFRKFLENHLRDGEGALAPAFRWISRPERGHSEVWVCGWDRPRLLERIAGAFLVSNINILSADIFTRGDNLALDIFRVCTTGFEPVTNEREKERVEHRLAESLRVEDYDFGPLLARDPRLRTYRISEEAELPTKIAVSNTTPPSRTLVDVQTPDRLGLLYDLLRVFGEAGVNIELSRITTERDVAIDSFYVTGGDGLKIEDPAALARLQRLLKKACSSGPRA
ncbi:MAG: HD domain-containing protein, partial [Terrimicrobiaceae bacterium]|nr:HD domain-containing protein [Terrimicrobiaceae bacterium]